MPEVIPTAPFTETSGISQDEYAWACFTIDHCDDYLRSSRVLDEETAVAYLFAWSAKLQYESCPVELSKPPESTVSQQSEEIMPTEKPAQETNHDFKKSEKESWDAYLAVSRELGEIAKRIKPLTIADWKWYKSSQKANRIDDWAAYMVATKERGSPEDYIAYAACQEKATAIRVAHFDMVAANKNKLQTLARSQFAQGMISIKDVMIRHNATKKKDREETEQEYQDNIPVIRQRLSELHNKRLTLFDEQSQMLNAYNVAANESNLTNLRSVEKALNTTTAEISLCLARLIYSNPKSGDNEPPVELAPDDRSNSHGWLSDFLRQRASSRAYGYLRVEYN